MILAAWLLTTIAQCLILLCLFHGVLGVHIWEISLEDAIWETTVSMSWSQSLCTREC